MFDPYEFEAVDWDDEEQDGSNLAHCLRHGVSELVVFELLRERPVELKVGLQTAGFAIVGPNQNWSEMWTVLFDRSFKRGDWLRPVTGWRSPPDHIRAWEQATRLTWKNPR